jgi:hypothetical protein
MNLVVIISIIALVGLIVYGVVIYRLFQKSQVLKNFPPYIDDCPNNFTKRLASGKWDGTCLNTYGIGPYGENKTYDELSTNKGLYFDRYKPRNCYEYKDNSGFDDDVDKKLQYKCNFHTVCGVHWDGLSDDKCLSILNKGRKGTLNSN